MKLIPKLFFTIFALCCSNVSAVELVVVANIDVADFSVHKRQVRDIFMKNTPDFTLKPIALTPSNDARFLFNTKIVGLTESRIQAYWAQMRFTGRKKPPIEFKSIETMLSYLQSNKNTVAYFPGDFELPAGLTVIYEVK